MRWMTPVLLGFSLVLGSCMMESGYWPDAGIQVVCTSDEQCDGNRVCFVDGCGDPGSAIVVEITPNNRAGQHAQDFAIDQLGAAQDFTLHPTTALRGHVEQDRPGDPGDGGVETGPYAGRISVRLSGESALLPGLPRGFELTTTLQAGEFLLPVASGQYAITLTPEDAALPPSRLPEVQVAAGTEQSATFTLPAADAVATIEGRVLSQALPILGSSFAIQAFEPYTQSPLSQLVVSDPLTGAFQLRLARTVFDTYVQFRVSPMQADVLLPTQSFEVLAIDGEALTLDFGAFGPVTTVTGRLLDRRGVPVSGATVYIEGPTESGGVYRSPTVRSDTGGRFHLPVRGGGIVATLWAVPPPRARSTFMVRGVVAISSEPVDLGDEMLGDRTPVTALVRRPEGGPAENVVVVAEPVDRVGDAPLPSSSAETITSGDGRLLLYLDRGAYRLNLNPGAPLPRVSRFIEVPQPALDLDGQALPQELEVLTLSRGRAVSGVLRATDAEQVQSPIPQATIRFFRVVDEAGRRSHVLLAEGATDEEGRYVVTLPTR